MERVSKGALRASRLEIGFVPASISEPFLNYKMWKRLSLRIRIFVILAGLLVITLGGGVVMVWYTYRMDSLLTKVVYKSLLAFQVAEELETALVNQKGFVSYYSMDRNPDWLRQLGKYRQIFEERLNQARSLSETHDEKQTVDLIESTYLQYIGQKDQVIQYYETGQREAGTQLHKQVRKHFFRILQLADGYKDFHKKRIQEVMGRTESQARNLRLTAASAMLIAVLLALFLASVLFKQILEPLRLLAFQAGQNQDSGPSQNEVKALSRSVHGLIEDVDQTRTELERSREHLVQAEKMALVGKLAAGTAHSIRNPLTSVKMRLFSLDRTLDLSPTQTEDFQVISEEIRHIDTIVQNFLEFSRPPKLKMQTVNPSDVVDAVIKLLRHRLDSNNVVIALNRQHSLPGIQADPEQLKEVLVNLIENACESMKAGGNILIEEEQGFLDSLGKVVIIRLTDNGPGIPESIKRKVFEPFFTTKEEGTGLGLSIARRIVEQHGGRLDAVSREGEGSTFSVTLPLEERGFEHDLDH